MNLALKALFCLCTIAVCELTIYKQFTWNFINGKTVSSSYLTVQPYSMLQCADRCSTQNTTCRIAEYNKVTKACRLSADSPNTVVDVDDDSVGVFFLPRGNMYTN